MQIQSSTKTCNSCLWDRTDERDKEIKRHRHGQYTTSLFRDIQNCYHVLLQVSSALLLLQLSSFWHSYDSGVTGQQKKIKNISLWFKSNYWSLSGMACHCHCISSAYESHGYNVVEWQLIAVPLRRSCVWTCFEDAMMGIWTTRWLLRISRKWFKYIHTVMIAWKIWCTW